MTAAWSLRITIAAVGRYLAATLVFPGPPPLLAPLTAMLVVQVTPVSLLASGLRWTSAAPTDNVLVVLGGISLFTQYSDALALRP